MLKQNMDNQPSWSSPITGLMEQQNQLLPCPHYIKVTPSGIRDHSSKLQRIVFRVGLIVGWLSAQDVESTYVIMITASHNPPQDNGVKLSGECGQLIGQETQKQIQQFINTSSTSFTQRILNQAGGVVFIGRDLRTSSPKLYQILKKALAYFRGVRVIDYGITTTPELFTICLSYRNGMNSITKHMTAEQMRKSLTKSTTEAFCQGASIVKWNSRPVVSLDCANGVCSLIIQYYQPVLQKYFQHTIINTQDLNFPNQECGSEYVQHSMGLPKNFNSSIKYDRCYSFDGDGDRLILYYLQGTRLNLMNGDRISSIMLTALQRIVRCINDKYHLNIRLGASCVTVSNKGLVDFITKRLNIPLRIVSVGVKHIYKAILQFQLGVFFQTSGHGGIYLRTDIYQRLLNIEDQSLELRLLLVLFRLSNNNSKGDAFRNFLVLQLCRKYLELQNSQLLCLYAPYNNVTIKTHISHKQLVVVEGNSVVSPPQLASFITHLQSQHPEFYIVVRPSSTESVIRISIQTLQSEEQAYKLAKSIEQVILNLKDLM